MGNGGTVEEGDHSAIAILAMPRESTDELELSQPILVGITPVEGRSGNGSWSKARSKNGFFQKRIWVSVCLSGISDIGECTAGLQSVPDDKFI